MKMFVVFVILLHVSQHALAVVVEVNEGEMSVLLPCQFSGFIPEDPTVMWTRSDLQPKSVHLQREGRDDLREQNQRYSGRTSMRPDALDSSDFSLTLRKPTKTDSGTYTCSITGGRKELRVTDIQLQVKDDQQEVTMWKTSDSVILPCKTKSDLPEDTTVEWTRADREPMVVHVYSSRSDHLKNQDDLYCGRTNMNEDLLRTGDLSLTLKYPTERDSGEYICTIYRDKDILRQKVVLQVKEPFPSWATVLLVLLGLLVLIGISGGLIYYFRHYFMSVYKVKVDSGLESVLLPCKARVWLPKHAKVEWKDKYNRKVHVCKNGSDQPEELHPDFKTRTKMKKNLLKLGDFSLTLKNPTFANTYTCTICDRQENIIHLLMEKKVELKVRDCLVEVVEGAESVELPFKTTGNLPEDATVEWEYCEPECRKVHVYENGSDQPDKQDEKYRDRTSMNEDLLKTGDLSLTLKVKDPTDEDSGRYRCEVKLGYKLLRRKMLFLKGRVQVQDQTGDIRNRSSSIDPTPLMADQSV
ncbi:uncharacterized protein LOC120438540 isoform X3 [Oreochromis aureus]|uniref:uncharacterized protein LOC120438540 isoform X3 n=1 Tax=Oreochromis aureus TaxID=47969 RepID=UPI001953B45A|nr:uncharacterized protein LOC120438540 isoform X3 [Oreochromis aureus]